ncbi:MAG: 4Fe-4S dicluster domain-containing protein [Terriglobia bacterium]|nr:4Fe-4S dicluster domain-containing protein [Terriglobia bacterium]
MATVTIRPDRKFIEDALECGGEFKKCYQCATCVSACSLATSEHQFPRKQVLLAQWGLRDELLADPGPWLCFYCGECSKLCPRKADPGEMMMALRRYLTTAYDWTGLSRLMYRSAYWEIGILLLVAVLVGTLFTVPQSFGFGLLHRSGPEAMSTVMLEKFAPVKMVHLGDTVLALILSLLLMSNALRMFLRLTAGRRIRFRIYLTQLPQFVIQAVAQSRWKQCNDPEALKNWIRHLLLVTGYGSMFTMVVVFLPWFQVKDASFQWTSILGYYATAVLVVVTIWMIVDRMRKSSEMHRFSHLSDWLFPVLLLLTAVTGIAVNVFRLMNLPIATYTTYAVHMMIAVPMLVVEVPFGKWAHLLYRPLGIYVAGVLAESAKLEALETGAATPATEHG